MKRLLLLFFLLSMLKAEAQAPNWLWAKSGNGHYWDAAWSVALDANGNSYVSGHYSSDTLSFNSVTVYNYSTVFQVFLAKYDAAGNIVWVRTSSETLTGANNGIMGFPVAVDIAGNIYQAGYFRSPSITFGSYTLINSDPSEVTEDIFLVKYDTNGNVIWAKREGSSMGTEHAYALSVNKKENLCMAGLYSSATVTFGSTTLTNTNTLSEVFYAVYDSSGTNLVAKSAGGTGEDWGISTVIDEGNNVYISGWAASPTISFDAVTLTNHGDDDIFVAKYDMNGNVIWATRAGGTSGDDAAALAVDDLGCVYVSGYYYSPSILFGSFWLLNPSTDKVFLVKYDPSGNVLWAKQSIGNGGDNRSHAIALDADANIYMAGYFCGATIKFSPFTLTNANTNISSATSDLFLTKYDSSGTVLWAKRTGSVGDDVASSVAVDNAGGVYVVGFYWGFSIAFDATVLNNAGPGDPDIFIAKLGNITTGTIPLAESIELPVYPNPAQDVLNVECKMQNSELKIYDAVGREVYAQKVNAELSVIHCPFSPGVYFVKVTDGEKVVTQKVVIE
jgi:hypothetical protein